MDDTAARCLRCGYEYGLGWQLLRVIQEHVCPRCGYAGWVPALEASVLRLAAQQLGETDLQPAA